MTVGASVRFAEAPMLAACASHSEESAPPVASDADHSITALVNLALVAHSGVTASISARPADIAVDPLFYQRTELRAQRAEVVRGSALRRVPARTGLGSLACPAGSRWQPVAAAGCLPGSSGWSQSDRQHAILGETLAERDPLWRV